ncbi:MAG: TolC family protein [Nitrospinae bacterium]|nr:TolC family protein [Nitrospinota bacterium]MBF0634973.1 TolC family protein [Nitrospinota bacterium]
MKPAILTAAIFTLVSAHIVFAGPKIAGSMTLESLSTYARDNNASIQSLKENVKAGQGAVDAENGAWWPQVSASFGRSRLLPQPDSSETVDDSVWAVTARQKIYDFGKTNGAVEKRKLEKSEAERRLARGLQVLQHDVAARYYDYLLSVQTVDALMQTNAIAYVEYDKAREKNEAGLVAQRVVSGLYAVSRAEKLKLERAKKEMEIKLAALQELIGSPIGDYFEVEPPSEEPPRFTLPEETGVFNAAVKSRPETQELDDRIAGLRAQIGETRSSHYPLIEGVAEVGDSDRRLPSRNKWEVGIRAKMDIFDGFTRRSREEELTARATALVFEKETLERKIRMEIKSALGELSLADIKMELAKAGVTAAQDNLDFARTQYELNLLTELGDALSRYAEAKVEWLRASYGVRMELERLNLATGGALKIVK